MKKSKIKAVAFVRVATENATNLHYQLDRIEEYAAKNNIEIEMVFENYDKNELDFEIGEMFWYCEENPSIAYVLVTEFHRISRDIEEVNHWVETFNEIGVEIKSVLHPTDNSPIAKFWDQVQIAVAGIDSNLRSHKVKEAMERKAKEGYHLHMPPVGYCPTNEKGLFQPNKFGKTFSEIVPVLTKRLSKAEMVSVLTAIYHGQFGRTPSKFELRRWLSNPYYVGLVSHAGQSYQGKHKPLFSQKEQERLLKALS